MPGGHAAHRHAWRALGYCIWPASLEAQHGYDCKTRRKPALAYINNPWGHAAHMPGAHAALSLGRLDGCSKLAALPGLAGAACAADCTGCAPLSSSCAPCEMDWALAGRRGRRATPWAACGSAEDGRGGLSGGAMLAQPVQQAQPCTVVRTGMHVLSREHARPPQVLIIKHAQPSFVSGMTVSRSLPRAVLLGVGALVGAWRFHSNQHAKHTKQVKTRNQRGSGMRHFGRHFQVLCNLLQVQYASYVATQALPNNPSKRGPKLQAVTRLISCAKAAAFTRFSNSWKVVSAQILLVLAEVGCFIKTKSASPLSL